MWIFYVLAALFAVVFVLGVVRERRRFRNAVLLGLALACLTLAVFGEIYRLPPELFDVATFLTFALGFLAVVVLAGFLLTNGITMLRREGRRPANLMSLLAGIACIVVLALPVATLYDGGHVLGAVTIALLLLTVYVAFLFCSFLTYAVVYGRLAARPGVDFVVVLGAGLIRGKVTPLLRSRLDRAIALRRREMGMGNDPVLVTSGGRGPDEPLAEAEAMAGYLLEQGVPEDAVLREDRSRTTLENLTFSDRLMAGRVPRYRCVVVTNNFHVFRTALLARQAGVDAQVLGSPTARYYWPSATIREFVAILAAHPVLNGVIAAGLVVIGAMVGAER
ncbi:MULTISPECIES: YdcF family protein [unclassified Pseudonocardia]|uniref:YdcF family protein n=1 Tax=unclassified Pseudonocardia TaxID=2619320 RepID=UPI0001FFE41A|nr:YdcF family protein [Pseudonocardia sp. Ae707_Ps1]OLM18588.1 hypothetical protein Ae707Ps1_2847 [Pseudonocardia sp. Ae707_Ps1]